MEVVTVQDAADAGPVGTDTLLAIWAKNPEGLVDGATPYPLIAHLLDTAVMAGIIWDRYLPQRLRDLLTRAIAVDDPDRARSLIMLAAGLHDIGKANPVFQFQAADSRQLAWRSGLGAVLSRHGLSTPTPAMSDASRGDEGVAVRRHEYVGYLALNDGAHVEVANPDFLDEKWLSVAISGHHGRWHVPHGNGLRVAPRLCEGAWGDAQQEAVDVVLDALGLDRSDLTVSTQDNPAVTIILTTGLVILADWLASDDARVAIGQTLIEDGLAPTGSGWISARTPDLTQHFLDSVGVYVPPDDPAVAVLGEHAATPRPLQTDAIALGTSGGLWTVAYPTGEGKTEAGLLRHIQVDEGLLFALPTRATTDAMHTRLSRIFRGTNPVILSHQFAAARTASTVCGGDPNKSLWFTKSIRRLIAPVAAMTCDQVLAGATAQRHGALRLFSLAAHHVVIDEVHTFDHYQVELLAELLAWWGATGTRVTLLSATLPKWQQDRFVSAYEIGDHGAADQPLPGARYPSHHIFDPATGISETMTPALSAKQQPISITLVHTDDTAETHAVWAVATRRRHPDAHIGVVVNTVDGCIKVAQSIATALPGAEVLCLHSRMTQAHRSSVEQTLTSRLGPDGSNVPLIVVGTQVIEASLDIDFDFMSSDLCPAPSLVQRAGRLQRFRDPSARTARLGYNPGARTLRVVVTVRDDEITFRSSLPYAPSEMRRVRDYLSTTATLRVPEDIQAFVDDCAFDLSTYWSQVAADAEVDKELAAATIRIQSARQSKAALTKDLIASRRGATYAALADATRDSSAEENMRTRYIDSPGGTYLLLDSRSPGNRWASADSARTMSTALAKDCLPLLDFVVPATYGLDRLLRPVHEQTLTAAGLATWEPKALMMSGLLPLDLALVEAADVATYHELTGLTRKET